MKRKKILITGVAGFIGSHMAIYLLDAEAVEIHGIDNLNDYYSPDLKRDRLKRIEEISSNQEKSIFNFYEISIEDKCALYKVFEKTKFDIVMNFAAQAGVRYSIDNPDVYIQSNIIGFHNLLELCREFKVEKMIYASSSSVYGEAKSLVGFKESKIVDKPISLYAATKKSNELIAHTYSHLFGIKTVGLRFFTVYGPWGRPDMAYFSFTKKIISGEKIDLYNYGKQYRDFTYIDDVVSAVYSVLLKMDVIDEKYAIFNIGNNGPETLFDFVKYLEQHLGDKAILNLIPKQPGDVSKTFANITKLQTFINFKPKTNLETGLKNFVDWYLSYYNLDKTNSCVE